MLFKDKLSFLLKLTMTSNRRLAAAINTDPSFVSRLKRGARGIPHNSDYVLSMANYFASQLDSDFQKAGLAETLGKPELNKVSDSEQLGQFIYDWLADNNVASDRRLGQFLGDFEQFTLSEPPKTALPSSPVMKNSKNYMYYGNAGRRAAVHALGMRLLEEDAPRRILITTDESYEWLLEKPEFSSRMTETMILLAKKGCTFTRIAGGFKKADAAFDSLLRWMPLYMTGQAKSFYYPRIRDDVYHRTLVVVPEVGALGGTSVGHKSNAAMTFLSFEPMAASVFVEEFNDYLAECKPMTRSYINEGDIFELCACVSRFESYSSECFRHLGTLPTAFTPPELIRDILDGIDAEQARSAYDSFKTSLAAVKANFRENRCVDIFPLASPEEVSEGRVPVGISFLCLKTPRYYTVPEYKEHLRIILEMLEHYGNYSVVIDDKSTDASVAICVKNGCSALLVRRTAPFAIFEVTERNVIATCTQYLDNLSKVSLSHAAQKRESIDALKRLYKSL